MLQFLSRLIANWRAGMASRRALRDAGVFDPFGVERKRLAKRSARVQELRTDQRHVSLDLSGTDVEEIPEGTSVQFAFNLSGCHRLRRLPAGLSVGSLDVSDCPLLEALPEGLNASFVDISECQQITGLPESASIRVGRFRARNCVGLTCLPEWMGPLSQLDLAGCAQISVIPCGMEVSSWIDIADTGVRELPSLLTGVALRWRGVAIDERIAFRPQEISAEEVLKEVNAELRRVKLERMGFARFLFEVDPVVLDSDTDPGGERHLYRVELPDDEPLVVVSVNCPSTARQYLLRVPPDTATCRQAIAWTAGFDNADDYAPLVET